MKKSERLRQQKGKAVERMAELTALAKAQNRDLTAEELAEFNTQKVEAESLTSQIETAVAEEAAAPAPAPNAERLTAEAVTAERNRVTEIQRLGAIHKIPAAELAKFVADGVSLQVVKDRCLDLLAARSEENPTFPHRAEVTRDERKTRREMMANALLHRYDPTTKLADNARQYRGMSLVRLAEECLTSVGVRTRGMVPSQLAAEALTVNGQGTLIGEDGIENLAAMSTSDFPYILANVGNKTLRAGYEGEQRRWLAFCRQANLSDFKAKYINQLGDAPDLEKVNESGEFKYGKIPEARESIQLATYGKILPLTRQAIINDDLGAFTRMPQLQGRAAARKENEIVWGLIISNPTMGDGVALFHADHGNLVNPGTAIANDSLGVMRKLMWLQKGLDSVESLELEMRFMLVPATKEQLALQYTAVLPAVGEAAKVNLYAGTVTPVVSGRLDANSTTAWYGVADPGGIDTIEYAYLEGQAGAYLETRVGFNVDGIELKCRLDFGAAIVDWRAFVKNLGA